MAHGFVVQWPRSLKSSAAHFQTGVELPRRYDGVDFSHAFHELHVREGAVPVGPNSTTSPRGRCSKLWRKLRSGNWPMCEFYSPASKWISNTRSGKVQWFIYMHSSLVRTWCLRSGDDLANIRFHKHAPRVRQTQDLDPMDVPVQLGKREEFQSWSWSCKCTHRFGMSE